MSRSTPNASHNRSTTSRGSSAGVAHGFEQGRRDLEPEVGLTREREQLVGRASEIGETAVVECDRHVGRHRAQRRDERQVVDEHAQRDPHAEVVRAPQDVGRGRVIQP